MSSSFVLERPVVLADALPFRDAVLVAGGAGLTVLGAQIAIHIPPSPVPVTGQTLAVVVAGAALGARRGAASQLLYVLLGLVLPVYSDGASGLDVIWGATGGYLVGFILASVIVGRLAELGWDRSIVGAVGAMALGSLVIYAVGVPWLAATAFSGDLATAFERGMRTFLVWDGVKLALAAAAFPAAWWFVGRRPGDR